jgi:hypothetical protein
VKAVKIKLCPFVSKSTLLRTSMFYTLFNTPCSKPQTQIGFRLQKELKILNNTEVAESIRFLGLQLDSHLNSKLHSEELSKKLTSVCYMRKLSYTLNLKT